MSILSFKDSGTADIYYGRNTKDARQILPSELHRAACRRLDTLDEAVELRALKMPGLRLHELEREKKGEWSISINRQYRICFRWTGTDAESVYIDDYH